MHKSVMSVSDYVESGLIKELSCLLNDIATLYPVFLRYLQMQQVVAGFALSRAVMVSK